MAYDAAGCEYIRLADPEIDRRLKNGPEWVSANFVIPYPPGFPIMVPGQVITQETIDFMRKLVRCPGAQARMLTIERSFSSAFWSTATWTASRT